MGTALGLALSAAGYDIQALVSRRMSQARKSSRLFRSGPIALGADRLAELPPSDIVLIATPDDATSQVAAALSSKTKANSSGRVALHTSGALSSAELYPLRGAGFSVGSMHPLLAVSDPVVGAKKLGNAFFCVEGDHQAVLAARKLVKSLGAQSFQVRPEEKPLYHAAAVMSSGHVVALMDVALEMLSVCGLSEKQARQVILPLVRSAVENTATSGTSRALTGSIARGDVATVKRHLDALRSAHLKIALHAYALMGLRSLALARKKKAPADRLDQIEKLLKKVLK